MPAMPELIPISELRLRQTEVLARLHQKPVLLTQYGKAAAVLIAPEKWNELQERLEDLEDTIDALEAKIAVLSGQDEIMPWEQLKTAREGVPD